MTHTTSHITIIVLGFNHADTIVRTLAAASAQTYPSYNILYIDNASSDDSCNRVRSAFPAIPILAQKHNIGFAGGCNRGMTQAFAAGAAAVVLLNPDTEPEPTWLAALVSAMHTDPHIGTIQGKIFLPASPESPQRLNTAGNRVHYTGVGFCGHYKDQDTLPTEGIADIPYASGAGVLITRTLYAAIGGFDETFFAYLEDQDYGIRARLAGYRNVIAYAARMTHFYDFHRHNRVSAKKFFLLERNRLMFLATTFSLRTLLLIMPAMLFLECGIIADSIMHGYFYAKMRSYSSATQHWRHIRNKRMTLMRTRVITDRALTPFLSPTIDFADKDSRALRCANKFFAWYWKRIRTKIS